MAKLESFQLQDKSLKSLSQALKVDRGRLEELHRE